VFAVLAAIAEFEREPITERVVAGHERGEAPYRAGVVGNRIFHRYAVLRV
jgi:DNA invertase Pin-like site-specific DNA recombinase